MIHQLLLQMQELRLFLTYDWLVQELVRFPTTCKDCNTSPEYRWWSECARRTRDVKTVLLGRYTGRGIIQKSLLKLRPNAIPKLLRQRKFPFKDYTFPTYITHIPHLLPCLWLQHFIHGCNETTFASRCRWLYFQARFRYYQNHTARREPYPILDRRYPFCDF